MWPIKKIERNVPTRNTKPVSVRKADATFSVLLRFPYFLAAVPEKAVWQSWM